MNKLHQRDIPKLVKALDNKGSFFRRKTAQKDLLDNNLIVMNYLIASKSYDLLYDLATTTGIGTLRGPLHASTDKNKNGLYTWGMQKKSDLMQLWITLFPFLSVENQNNVIEMCDVFNEHEKAKKEIAKQKTEKIIQSGIIQCSSCQEYKPLDQFGIRNTSATKFRRHCKPCKKKKHLEYMDQGGKRRQRELRLAKKYGLTGDEVHKMLIDQSYKCKICNILLEGIGNQSNAPNIDHCHYTNNVRGILCGNCNRGLGLFFDKPENLEAAIQYLKHH